MPVVAHSMYKGPHAIICKEAFNSIDSIVNLFNTVISIGILYHIVTMYLLYYSINRIRSAVDMQQVNVKNYTRLVYVCATTLLHKLMFMFKRLISKCTMCLVCFFIALCPHYFLCNYDCKL